MSQINYSQTRDLIVATCAEINIQFGETEDGRIASAVKETEYLDKLEQAILTKNPDFIIDRPKARHWYDIRINGIPINLKLTTGGTDNAFNKVAIAYTISGEELQKKNMNYNAWFQYLKTMAKKPVREKQTEYHYLVLNKTSGKILFKSILDIHSYKSNPCNDMQINWQSEFAHLDYYIADENFREKIKELLKTVQKSVRQLIESMREFADADIDALF
jgi:hypothetical protein